jgi:FkbM family methyltransferase
MKSPVRQEIFLREVGSDMLTFNEVMIEQVYRGVVERVPDCRTMIDLGANVGLATLYFAAHYPACRFYAVEPNPDTYALLRRNLEALVAAGRCETFQGAVWGSEQELVAAADWSSDHFSRFAGRERADGEADGVAFKGLPIDRLMEAAGFDHVDLIKADIEGAETELFRGDLGWLERVGAIAIEFHGDSRDVIRFDDVMREHGFGVVDEGGHTVLAVREGRRAES